LRPTYAGKRTQADRRTAPAKCRLWVLLLVVAIEVLLALFVRDNLTLNILMLFFPIESIKQWQLGA
jgi:hypothetical protein